MKSNKEYKIPFTKDWFISWGSYYYKKYSVSVNLLPSIEMYFSLSSYHKLFTFSWLTFWFQIGRFNCEEMSSMIEKD